MKKQQFRCFQKVAIATKNVAEKPAYFLSNSGVSNPVFPYRQKNLETAESAWMPNSAYFGVSICKKHRGNTGNTGNIEISKGGM
jgi:hypothetical protein